MKRSFGSDNHSGINEKIAVAMLQANRGDEIAYGDDLWTKKATEKMKKVFGERAEIFFVFNGTGANTVAVKSMTRSYNAVIAAETAHINVDECGAVENFCGCKIKTVKTPDGKLTPKLLEPLFHGRGDMHHVQPKVISITQATELGTVYTPEEIKEISKFAKEKGLYLHMDGARLANAAVHLKKELAEISTECGVDVLSFGGTKNGMAFGEAVVVMRPEIAKNMVFFRKQGMQLPSKMRFVSSQFDALLRKELWKELAGNANEMAQLLYNEIKGLNGIEVVYPVESNAVFAKLDKEKVKKLQKKFFFYVWDEDESIARWMTHWAIEKGDVLEFAEEIKRIVKD
ncbi:MAG: threonine aldolase family protein [bacterium]